MTSNHCGQWLNVYFPTPMHSILSTKKIILGQKPMKIAETSAIHLSKIFLPHEDIIDPEHCSFISNQLDIHLLPLPSILKKYPELSPSYQHAKHQIRPHYTHYPEAPYRKSIFFITSTYNVILRTAYFPVLWKFSVIKMIHKKGKPLHPPSSYRPISLLPYMCKILEKLILQYIFPNNEPLIPSH